VRRGLLLTSLLLALPAPAEAEGATRHIVRGAGFGHGIGMSQYGAYGFAQNGRGYREILSHYYRGSHISRASSRAVRVILQPNDPYVRFRGATRAGGERLRPEETYVARPAVRGGLTLRTAAGKLLGRFSSPLRVSRRGHALRLLGPALNGVSSGLYRGAIELTTDLGGVSAVNVIGMDPYLQGVVPGEMPSSWHMEALKAQAVAARSYALATRKPSGVFDQYPDTRSQVYRGVTGESPRSSLAVRETSGEILSYGSTVVVAYYFSTSGGQTENVENSFLGSLPRPFLVSVPDPYDGISPRHRWRLTFSQGSLQRRLRGHVRGRLRKVSVVTRGASPRIVRARVHGTRGVTEVSGPTLRARLDLYDTWAYFTRVSTSQSRSSRVRLARSGSRLGPFALVGSFDPVPRGRRLVVERRSAGHWKRAGGARLTRSGRYHATLRSAGLYRVRAGSLAGPAVRVR
jgi:stage II sporulation protein D